MTVVLHTLNSDAAREAFLAARTRTRRYAAAAGAAGAEMGGAEGAEALAICEALTADSLSALTGRAPAAPIRHLPTLSRKVREIAAEVQGHEVDDAVCPVLAADGISGTDAMMLRQRNGRSAVELRATSERCPFCLAADVIRTLRRDGAEARDADARWNRRGA